MKDYIIRKIEERDYPLLEDFLYEAVFIPDGAALPPRSIIRSPELQIYIKDFGRHKDDMGFIAETDGRAAGAVWTRIMNDYGHIDDGVPSLAIALYAEYRKMGIGTALLEAMLAELGKSGYERVSLSVQKENYAVKMYVNAGFRVFKDSGGEYIMVCGLR